jgi:hypothetical protein
MLISRLGLRLPLHRSDTDPASPAMTVLPAKLTAMPEHALSPSAEVNHPGAARRAVPKSSPVAQ